MNSKITELDLVSVVDQNDVLPIVNGGITKKVKVSQLVQDLQSVTDEGASTNNTITINKTVDESALILNRTAGDPGTALIDANSQFGGTCIKAQTSSGSNVIEAISNGNGLAILASSDSNVIQVNSITGIPIQTFGNGDATPSIEVNLGNTNKGVVVDSGTSSTGNPIEVNKNGVQKFRVAQNGNVTTDVISANGDVLILEASNVQIILDDTGSSVTVSEAEFIANQSISTPLVQAGQYRIPALNTAPATATSTGVLGEIRYTSDFIYVCIATNTWRRTALTSW